MILLEHDAKGLLADAGVPVPAGVLADGPGPIELPGNGPWVVKRAGIVGLAPDLGG